MHIAMIGGGYVGLVSAACFAQFGTDVTVVEADAAKLAAGVAPAKPDTELVAIGIE